MPTVTVELIQGREAIERLRKAHVRLAPAMHKAIRQAGELVRGSAITNILSGGGATTDVGPKTLHARSGRLRKSITMRSTGTGFDTVALVGPGPLSYAAIHEFGGHTAAHVIKARRKPLLKFMISGQWISKRQVQHPGSRIPARPYLRPALTDNLEKIRLLVQRAIAPALKGES